jgi:arsenite methyltransferase
MSKGLQFDEAGARHVEALYRTPDIVEQRRLLLDTLRPQPGDKVLDIGSGPGFLAIELAEAVGPDGAVHGLDPSESMLALSRARSPRPRSAPLEFHQGDANMLPFQDDSFDVVTVTQVYEYVEDMAGALAEAHRVVRPGGRMLVLDTDWDSTVWASNDDERMRRMLAVWDEHLVDPHLPRRLTTLLTDAGFAVTTRTIIPLFNAGYDPHSYSAGMIEAIASFVAGRGGLTESEATAWANDLVSMANDYFFSVNRYLFIARKQ